MRVAAGAALLLLRALLSILETEALRLRNGGAAAGVRGGMAAWRTVDELG